MSRSVPDGSQLWLVRHGETEWTASHRHTGRTDLPLTAAGEAQAAALRTMLAGIDPVLVVSSPRARALQTAELAGIAIDRIDPDAAEWDYGDYEGLTSPQIRELDPDWTIWTGTTPHGESPADVSDRADRVLGAVEPHLGEGPIMIFGHGHMNRALAARWLGMSISAGGMFALDTAAPCLLGAEHGRPALVHWNIVNPAASTAP
ncbi:MAG: acid phosphatase [Jatrophihabitantaceae bacterium]|nr:acid phosphatase [Jatrophihabitantaceae bacterium]